MAFPGDKLGSTTPRARIAAIERELAEVSGWEETEGGAYRSSMQARRRTLEAELERLQKQQIQLALRASGASDRVWPGRDADLGVDEERRQIPEAEPERLQTQRVHVVQLAIGGDGDASAEVAPPSAGTSPDEPAARSRVVRLGFAFALVPLGLLVALSLNALALGGWASVGVAAGVLAACVWLVGERERRLGRALEAAKDEPKWLTENASSDEDSRPQK